MKKYLFTLFVLAFGISNAQITNKSVSIMNTPVPAAGIALAPPTREINLFGSGGLRSVVTNENTENPATGSLGISINDMRYEFAIAYTVNELETININNQNDFGRNLLVPDIGGTGFTLSSHYLPNFPTTVGASSTFLQRSGFKIDYTVGIVDWGIDSLVYSAAPMSFKAGLISFPFLNIGNNNDVSVALFLGYSARMLGGNLGLEKFDEIRQNAYGTTRTSFRGFEASVKLLFNQMQFFCSYSHMKTKTEIEGISEGQVLIGVNISDFISL